VGADKVVNVAKKMGIQFRAPHDALMSNPPNASGWGSFTLGVSATTPLELANAYATIAADGTYCEPMPVVEITDRDGKKLDAANPRCKNVIDPEVARAAVDMARCPVGGSGATGGCAGHATAPGTRTIVNRGETIAGKSGTTDDGRSATFTAMTKQLAVSGFLTDPDYPLTNKQMQHPPVNTAVAYVLKDGMAGRPSIKWTAPLRDRSQGKLVNIPSVKCQSVAAAKSTLSKKGFSADVGQQVASDCPAGTVAATTPDGATVKGGSVTLLISKGGGNPAPGQGGNGNTNGNGNGTGPGRRKPGCNVPVIC
jgi:membrane peptidoglycan carboxypeptidase